MLTSLLLALALLVLPDSPARGRLGLGRRRELRVPRTPLVLAGGVVAALLGGPGGVVAAVLVGVVVLRGLRSRAEQRARLAATSALTEGLGGVVAELRAGAHPASAASGAATDVEMPAAVVLRGVAATARLGGDVGGTLRDLAAAHPALRTALGQLARAWQLSNRYGVPLADVLDAVRRDLDRRVTFARQVHARMAGPRASTAVLAALPGFGLLLGELSGARPLHVLSGTPPGQVLLVAGAALVCAGLLWTERLTGQAVLA